MLPPHSWKAKSRARQAHSPALLCTAPGRSAPGSRLKRSEGAGREYLGGETRLPLCFRKLASHDQSSPTFSACKHNLRRHFPLIEMSPCPTFLLGRNVGSCRPYLLVLAGPSRTSSELRSRCFLALMVTSLGSPTKKV